MTTISIDNEAGQGSVVVLLSDGLWEATDYIDGMPCVTYTVTQERLAQWLAAVAANRAA